MIAISDLKVNYLTEPTGIKNIFYLSWAIESDKRNVVQDTYQIKVRKAEEDSVNSYDSGIVESKQSVQVPVNMELESIVRYIVCVRITAAGETSEWKEAVFISALQNPDEWRGKFISVEPKEDKDKSYGSLLRQEFTLKAPIKEAWLVSSAHGIYHAFLNGKKVCKDEMSPGWTSYNKRLLYQTYEVTDLLTNGKNVLGIMLGAGWYKGLMGYKLTRNNYGIQTAFGGQLLIRYANGSEEWIVSDESWKGSKGPVLFSEIYDGEIYDAREEQPDWDKSGFDDSSWEYVCVVGQETGNLYPRNGSPVRVMERIGAVSVITTPEGDKVLDFGQNLTGWCEFSMENTKEGDIVELQFFEILDAKGNVYTDNLRSAKETIQYICKGDKKETYRPWFTFQGFRYIKVIAYPGEINLKNFTACVVYSDMEQTGSFQCSNPLLNQLWHNILWGMKGNFLDIPTDCPQRDERLGWTGDAQIFGRTASFLMNTNNFYSKWLADVSADQTEDGAVPHVVPDILTGDMTNDGSMEEEVLAGASGWADAAVTLPWIMYLVYGDKAILERQIDSILAWVQFMKKHSEGCRYRFGSQPGDWLALDAEEGSYRGATPIEYTSSVYYCYSTELVTKILHILGNEKEAKYYEKLLQELKEDFKDRYFDKNGVLKIRTQTAYVLALVFRLVPEESRKRSLEDLKLLLEREAWHLTTGFLGTPQLLFALSENGCLDGAYELLLKEDFPSWLYQVKAGATTIWEHWDGLKPDGTMWSSDMNSFNHYAYGAVGEWLYRTVAGLELDEKHPGYEHFYIIPRIGGNLSNAEVIYKSVRGCIVTRWKRKGREIILEAEIPANSSADIVLTQAAKVLDGDGLEFAEEAGGYRASAGSGKYKICYAYKEFRDATSIKFEC